MRTAQPPRVGLIGMGTIGCALVALARETNAGVQFVGAVVRDVERRRAIVDVTLLRSVAELSERRPDVVAEVAGHEGLRVHGPEVLRRGIDLIVVAVGAFADPAAERELFAAAEEGNAQIRIASGAIGGLDALSAAKLGGLSRVTHTTRKPPHTLLSADEARTLVRPLEVFRGSAREGALRFPESINVAAAVSLAGIGLDRTEVVVLADPTVDRNRHVVEAVGSFGVLTFEIANVPTEGNPRTGRLTAMSVVHELLKPTTTLSVG